MRILLSDGSGLTARQVATILGRAGHHVEAVTAGRLPITRFTRHVRRLNVLPPFGSDPLGWFEALERLLARRPFDVLLPTQEQVAVLALRQSRLEAMGVQAPLPNFAALRQVQDKLAASETLRRIGLAQPSFAVASDQAEARAYLGPFPVYLKAPAGTASTAVRFARDRDEMRKGAEELAAANAFETGGILIQAAVKGPLAMVQAVFQHGRLLASHANLRVREGAGGGAAVKESLDIPAVRRDLGRLGAALEWNGALSLDAILTSEGPLYIDVNPCIVEPMNALASGVDLLDALLSVAFSEDADAQLTGRTGVRTHQGLLALLGAAGSGGRREVCKTLVDLAGQRGDFAMSTEELTPSQGDLMSLVPLGAVALAVLLSPASWRLFSHGAVSRYALAADGWRAILRAAQDGTAL